MASRLRLADLLAGLSLIADTGYGLSPGHAMRSCLVAVSLARKLGLAESEVSDTFYTSLLFHVGCVGFSHELSAAFGDDIAANRAGARTNFADPRDIFATLIPQTTQGLPPMARARATAFITLRGRAFGRRYDTTVCEVARHTARRIGLPDSVQRSLYEVREWWNGGGAPQGLRGEQILLPARIARLATDAVLFADIEDAQLAVAALRHRAGGILDPSLVEEFAGSAQALLTEVSTGDPREKVLAAEPQPLVEKEIAELPEVAAAFGELVDLKTPFTHGHSGRVAGLAKAAAATLGFDAATAHRLHVAAFLHDIGRVGVPNSVWEKTGPLTSVEWEQVRMHPYHSERILAMAQTLEPMARLAGMHHER
ncbi:MAG TPA: metal-dependent phosphohydrolase, partial [Micromonosporaceae bacterium]|nr:metal-dependent phosphohydrolase [Micromonosporaceae bacterium]